MIDKISVRFFVFANKDDCDCDTYEVTESCFLACEGEIEYTRHTVWQNGADQICLYKSGLQNWYDLETLE